MQQMHTLPSVAESEILPVPIVGVDGYRMGTTDRLAVIVPLVSSMSFTVTPENPTFGALPAQKQYDST